MLQFLSQKSRFLGEAKHDVHILNRLSRRAFDEIVDRRYDYDLIRSRLNRK
jgi:hypothetical protein